MNQTPSPYQQAIFAAVLNKESIIVEAVAGSGKTWTIVEAATQTKACRGLALAFNKRIQMELAARLPRHFEALTLNSLGHRAWGSHITEKIKIDTGKIFKICKAIQVPSDSYSEIMALVNMARNAGVVPNTPRDTTETWMELAATYDLDCSRDLIVFSREVLTNSIHQALAGILDFNDQIYMPTLFGAAFPTFDIIMVDEAQDLSQLQHEMLAQLLHNKSRIIAVGDTHQAIYGFRGALNNSMTRLQSQFNLRKLPLTISYRCPKSVVREAQTVVSHIESHPDAPEGRVGISGGISVMDFPVGSAILCRNNAPLVSLAWLFIRASIPVTFLGKDLGKKLEKLVKKLAKTDVPIDILEHNLGKWAAREIAKQPRREASIQDQVDTLRSLFADCLSSKQVLAKITAIFEQTTGGRITLASIHTSKGFEWPTVYFLNDYLIPSKYAKQDWQLEQEDNLRYVAITRAQETLLYLDTKDVY